jgi:hypothetical protein
MFDPIPRRRSRKHVAGGLPKNKFELIFHELIDGQTLKDELEDRWPILVADNPVVNEMSEEEESEQESDSDDEDA